jgi:hypothetical protein
MLASLRPALRDLVRFDRSKITYVSSSSGDVDTTLERLSSALRRSSHSLGPVPDLRADQNVLVEAADSSGRARAPLLLETERITNSLNTMVDLVQRSGAHLGSPPAGG